jgi:hypothetical protein
MRSIWKIGLAAAVIMAAAGSAHAAKPAKVGKFAALPDDRCEVPNRRLDRIRGCNENTAKRKVVRRNLIVKNPPPPPCTSAACYPNAANNAPPPPPNGENHAENTQPDKNRNEYIYMGEQGYGGRDGGNGANGGNQR